jgi:predicted amidohydrolase
MKIALAQIHPLKGQIDPNIQKHLHFIQLAIGQGAKLIAFSELSLTGYEPELADKLAITEIDNRFTAFQKQSNQNGIVICLGMPIRSNKGIQIGMLIFQPNRPLEIYAKQHLHEDELPFFMPGTKELIIERQGYRIAPAICYESLLPAHAAKAAKANANVYLASVAKPAGGMKKAEVHYPQIAKQYVMPVLMSNCIGFCDNFESVGQTSVWDEHGNLKGQLNTTEEGILVYDLSTKTINTIYENPL